MKPTAKLHDLGQSLWLDNITRTMLGDGTLAGLHRGALGHRADLQPDDLRQGDLRRRRLRRADRRAERAQRRRRTEERLLRAGDRRPARRDRPLRAASTSAPPASTASARSRSHRCSPTTPQATIEQAAQLHAQGRARQPLHQDPRHRGRPAGDRGVDLRRHPDQRHPALLDASSTSPPPTPTCGGSNGGSRPGSTPTSPRSPRSSSAAGTSPSPSEVPDELRNRLGLAVGFHAYRAYRELLDSQRMQRLMNEGARPQRLLWASTGTKDPDASDTLYIEGFASPFTVNTMPEPTLHRLRRPRRGRRSRSRPTAATATSCWPQFESAGIDVDALAARLQEEGKEAFVKSWNDLLESIESERESAERRA